MEKIQISKYRKELYQMYLNDLINHDHYEKDLNTLNRSEKDELSVLYIGKLIIEDMLQPFLDAVIEYKKFRKVKLFACYSESNTELSFQPFETRTFEIDRSKGRIIKISHKNLTKEKKIIFPEINFNNPKINEKYDLIFCFFELHFLLNWRQALMNILQLLNERGRFYFCELKGEITILDGNLGAVKNENISLPKYKNFQKKILNFKQKRNEVFYWSPEIRISDYSAVMFFLSQFFYKIEQNKESRDQVKLLVTKDHLERYKLTGCFDFLSKGLKDNKFEIEIEKDGLHFDYGLKFYNCQYFNKARFEKEDTSFLIESRVTTPFIKSINLIPDFSKDGLGRKALQTAYQSDIYFPDLTDFIGLEISKEALDTKRNFYLKYELDAEKKLIDKTVTLSKENHKLPSKILYEELKFNSPVYLIYLTIPLSIEELNKEEDKLIKKLNELAIVPSVWVQNIKQEGLHVFKPDERIELKSFFAAPYNRINQESKIELEKWLETSNFFEEKKTIVLDKYSQAIELVSNFTIKRNLDKNVNSKIDKKSLQDIKNELYQYELVEDELYLLVRRDGDGNLQNLTFTYLDNALKDKISFNSEFKFSNFTSSFEAQDDIPMTTDFNSSNYIYTNIFEELISVGYHFSDATSQKLDKGDEGLCIISGYFPSEYIEKDIEENNVSTYLGCLFFKENYILNITSKNNILLGLVLARNSVLSRVADYVIHRIGLYHFINSKTKRYARKTAIAAISARNVSHNMGSHVIPSIKGIKKSFSPELKRHYDYFLDYMQQRNDFINHLSSSSSNWSISTWFVKELMFKLMKQYLLLDNLCSNEGLRIYDYSKYGKYLESNYYESEYSEYANEDEISTSDRVVIYGKYLNGKIRNFNLNFIEDVDSSSLNNRKIRIQGEYANSNQIDNASLIESNIIIDVRRRKYRTLNNPNKSYYESNFIESDLLVDLSKNKIDIKKFSFKALNYFYAIVSEITINKEEESLVLALFNEIPNDEGLVPKCKISFTSEKREEGGVESDYKRVKRLIQKKKIIVGSRLIFTNNKKVTFDSNVLYFKNPKIEEISFSEHLIHLDPKVGYSNINSGDIKVDIPGGISGYQSFYTIIENIIRNASKHNWTIKTKENKYGKNLEVKIELQSFKSFNFFICKVWTNLFIKDIYKLTDGINKVVKQDIVGKNLEFKKEFLGTAEIKINAAFLHKKYQDITNNEVIEGEQILLYDKGKTNLENEDSYLKASKIFDSENGRLEKRLGYRFKLHKPVNITIVDTNENIKDQSNYGIQYLNTENNELYLNKERNKVHGSIFIINQSKVSDQLEIQENHKIYIENYKFNKIIDKISMLITNGISNSKEIVSDLLDSFLKRVDIYPNRIIYVLSSLDEFNKLLNSIKFIKDNPVISETLKTKVQYFKKRIYFSSREEVGYYEKELLKESFINAEIFNLVYYKIWLKRYCNARDYNVRVIEKKSSAKVFNYQSLPNIFYDHIISEKEEEVEKKFENSFRFYKCKDEGCLACGNNSEINKCPKNDPEPINIIYERHDRKDIFDYFGSEHKVIHAELISGKKSSYQLFKILNLKKSNFHRQQFKLRLLENALINILIIDERAVNYFYKDSKDLTINKLLSQGIYIPSEITFLIQEKHNNPKTYSVCGNENQDIVWDLNDKSYVRKFKDYIISDSFIINLDEQNIIEYNINLKIKIPFIDRGDIENEGLRPDYFNTIVIHQSILEKALQMDDLKGNRAEIIENIINIIRMNIPSVIITSGRSKSWFSKITKFIPFSVIEELVMNDSPDKLMFSELLLNSKI